MLAVYDLSLGAYQGGAGPDCKPGWGYLCGPRGGIYSCRPCDYPQLEAFQRLQKLANQLVVAFRMNDAPSVITGLHTVSGGYKLALDGRVGPATKRTVAAIMAKYGPKLMAPSAAALAAGKFEDSYEYVAEYIPELIAYFEDLVRISNAPENVPAPPRQPIASVTAPGAPPRAQKLVAPPPVTPIKRKGNWLVLGLAGLAAVGLVGAGVYYYRSEQA